MSDLNPYEEGLANDLAKAQARIKELQADLRKMALDYLAAQGQASENFQMYVGANEARIDAEAKLASVIAAYRIEAMRRDGYSHEAFDQHIAELKGETNA